MVVEDVVEVLEELLEVVEVLEEVDVVDELVDVVEVLELDVDVVLVEEVDELVVLKVIAVSSDPKFAIVFMRILLSSSACLRQCLIQHKSLH